MSLELEHWEAIDRMLGDAGNAAHLEESVPGWRFGLNQAQTEWARLLLDDEWAGFEAALPNACRGASDWELLELNAVLPGACKIGLRPSDQRRLLLDIPLDNGAAVPARCRMGMADLIACWTWLDRAVPAGPVGRRGEGVPIEWIRAAGWSCQERGDGRIVVQSEVRGLQQPIWVGREESGLLRLWASLGPRQELAEASQLPLGRYLLRVAGQRRLVRAAADLRDASAAEIRFEVRLPEPLDAGLVDHGLTSLAVAIVTAGREARALASGSLAGHYAGMWCSSS